MMDINGNPPHININPFIYESYVCSECGHEVFIPGVIFKKVPRVALGQGSGTIPFPVKIAICAIAPFDKEKLNEAEELTKKSKDANNSGLII